MSGSSTPPWYLQAQASAVFLSFHVGEGEHDDGVDGDEGVDGDDTTTGVGDGAV